MKRFGLLLSFILLFANGAKAQSCESYLKKLGHKNYKSYKEDITEIAYSLTRDPNSNEFEECRNPRYEGFPNGMLWTQGMNFYCNDVIVGRTVFNIRRGKRGGSDYLPGNGVYANYFFDSLGRQMEVGHIAKRYQKESQSCKKISDDLFINESEKVILQMWIPATGKYHVRKSYSVWRYLVF